MVRNRTILIPPSNLCHCILGSTRLWTLPLPLEQREESTATPAQQVAIRKCGPSPRTPSLARILGAFEDTRSDSFSKVNDISLIPGAVYFFSLFPHHFGILCLRLTGDIFRLEAFGQRTVILNRLEHARELMEKRSAIYSDRPRMTYIVEM